MTLGLNHSQVCAKVNDVQIQQVPLTPDFDVVVAEVSPLLMEQQYSKRCPLVFTDTPLPEAVCMPFATYVFRSNVVFGIRSKIVKAGLTYACELLALR